MIISTDSYKKTTRGKRVRRILLSMAITVIALGGFGFWYWNSHKNVIIENEIEKAITKSNEGFYRISYEDMIVDEATGSLLVSDMKLSYDSLRYQEKRSPMLFTIHIPEIRVVGVKTKKALLDKEIVGRKLEIRNPGNCSQVMENIAAFLFTPSTSARSD